jgi:SAM-dependent methyltransferase
MTADELETLGERRRDADGRYNVALTALDQAVVTVSRLPSVGPEHREHVATALMQFLQQITGFVETKDRELAAVAATRVDQVAREIQSLGELRTHIGVLQRAMEMLKRSAGTSPSAVNPQGTAPAPAVSTLDDYKYLGFEDAFRGSDAVIEARLQAYVLSFSGRSRVLDIGCGRGEMLAALKGAGTGARGIDLNAEMVAVACDRGLDATRADALEYLSSLPDESLDGLIATQVIEHLEPSYLMRLLDAAARKLLPGSPIVLETINPACWLAFFSSYLRDFTHVRPVHPDTLKYLLIATGFQRVEIEYRAPYPESEKLQPLAAGSGQPATGLADVVETLNANVEKINRLLFTYLDYAAVGRRG